ncbi:transposase [Rhodovastum atsumiense]|uniref:IS200/IS605 family element transposase accessory protein TnpB n=1 Tax=Rhodovastum atsumiense TaxID=504468 RepID=A0A5M6IRZ2_9PROT|nr:IS200/IS605 family accessory protein TnpB-related protein [Rhodovastum atsumiense]KAA5610657.1 IS200/IS605 family element transposase accessory protein TnpB [Rhodovastum atsumiense]CAH2603355.1 transposase [Rhodovastum atsumiense]
MSRTFCAIIRDGRADSVLAPFGELMGKAIRAAFKEIHILQRPAGDVQKELMAEFGLTRRHLYGARTDAAQAANAWKGTCDFRATQLRDAIEATEERIAALGRRAEKAKTERKRKALLEAQILKKKRLDVLKGCLASLLLEIKEGVPRVCFGGRKLLRDGDVWAWRDRRNSRIFVPGAKHDNAAGNQSIQWDGENLLVRMPDSLGGHVETLRGVTFRYGQEQLRAVLERNRDFETRAALTWLLFKDGAGRWHAHVTVDEPAAELVTDARNGVVAVDVNVDHFAVTLVDYWGNPVGRLTLPFPVAGTDEGKAEAMIGDAVRALSLLARKRHYGIAIEDLEFSKKKAGLREYGAAHARRLSGFAYRKFAEFTEARCKRDGVDLVKVNPAFTSVIGRWKYAKCRGMSAHHAAALCIGRKALGHGERLVSMDGTALDSPARMSPRAERRRWRGVRRLSREGAHLPVRTAWSGTGTAGKGVPKGTATATTRKARPARTGCRSAGTVQPQVGVAVALASDLSRPSVMFDT